MSDRHSREAGQAAGDGEDDGEARAVLDLTDLSPREVRARVKDMQTGREAQVDRARDQLSESLARFRAGVRDRRARAWERTRSVAPMVAGVAAAGATTVLVVKVGGNRAKVRRGARPV